MVTAALNSGIGASESSDLVEVVAYEDGRLSVNQPLQNNHSDRTTLLVAERAAPATLAEAAWALMNV